MCYCEHMPEEQNKYKPFQRGYNAQDKQNKAAMSAWTKLVSAPVTYCQIPILTQTKERACNNDKCMRLGCIEARTHRN